VVSDPAGAARSTRRTLLRRWQTGIGVGAVAGLAGCGKSSNGPSIRALPAAAKSADVILLNQALDLEHEAIAAYTAGIPLLDGRAKKAAQLFLTQELSHAGEMHGLVKQAGGRPNKPKASYDLGRPGSALEVLRLLHDLERRQLQLYLGAITRLSPQTVRAAVAAVLANDAQHVSMLRSVMGLAPLPSPFVTGVE
jgi:rubrerythrin